MHRERSILENTSLGKKIEYISDYNPSLLYPIPRALKRQDLGITQALPFVGQDIWNAFEISWLNTKGKPMVGMAEFIVPCESTHLIESKSLKLYLYSLNQCKFDSIADVERIIQQDLSATSGAYTQVTLAPLYRTIKESHKHFSGFCLDDLDISCDTYETEPAFLTTENHFVTETVYSDLLRSNCLVTGQPDWGSVQIFYSGNQIQHEGLLKYIVSFRNHVEFHEHCVERIFMDIMTRCQPEKLCVYARYTRRGGIDINPYRANFEVTQLEKARLCRQ